MSGYLRHLVQRSLTAVSSVRPRPVSKFEAGHLSTDVVVSPAARFSRGPYNRSENYDLTEEGGTVLPGTAQELTGKRLRRATERTETILDTRGQDPVVQPAVQVGKGVLTEESLIPAFSKSVRPERQNPEDLNNPQASQAVPDETSIHASTESIISDSGSLRTHHLHVQGKRVAKPESKVSETLATPLPDERQHASLPTKSEQITSSDLLDHATLVEPEVRLVDSCADQFGGLSRKEPSDIPQAILTPRLPQSEPVAQSLQPSMSKTAEPIIQVTIGRVEIRAVASVAAPKRSAPTKPTLSLTDYLHGRSGGHG